MTGGRAVGQPIKRAVAVVGVVGDFEIRHSVFDIGHFAFASNSWVISGRRTESGKPILANDPHLTLREVVGATIPGAPVVVLGHTAAVAWGFTNAMEDDDHGYRAARIGENAADGH